MLLNLPNTADAGSDLTFPFRDVHMTRTVRLCRMTGWFVTSLGCQSMASLLELQCHILDAALRLPCLDCTPLLSLRRVGVLLISNSLTNSSLY